MLQRILIDNYALIEHTEVQLSKGFTVITGETGAGKSILIEALGLVLGARANFSSIRKGKEKCIVEGQFTYSNPEVDRLLRENELDVLDDIILRRELTTSGRSRAFVNDSPCSLNTLKEISSELVSLHSQQENQSILSGAYQLGLVDAYAGLGAEVDAFGRLYKVFADKQKQLEEARQFALQASQDLDYIKFQLAEFSEVDFSQESFNEKEEFLAKLENIEEIKMSLYRVSQILDNEENGVVGQLTSISSDMSKMAHYAQSLNQISERIEATRIELKDISAEVEYEQEKLELDPEQAETIRVELDRINRLLSKHSVQTIGELEAVYTSYEEKLGNISLSDERIEALSEEIQSMEADLRAKAGALHKSREAAIGPFREEVEELLHSLGMPKATIKLQLTLHQQFNSAGLSSVELLFNANGPEPSKSIKDVASGGELSRLMLALKSILAAKRKMPTLIFDEIDTGVGGEVAKQIGVLMQKISHNSQVISITHLPGVASKGQHHIKIEKQYMGDQVISILSQLSDKERIGEIASMFTGAEVSKASLESARDLLGLS